MSGTFLGTNNLLKLLQPSRLLAEGGKDPASPRIHCRVSTSSTTVLSLEFLVDASGSLWWGGEAGYVPIFEISSGYRVRGSQRSL